MSQLAEIQSAIRRLSPAEQAELRQWIFAQSGTAPDPNSDSAELEAELLKVEETSFVPYVSSDLRVVCERVAQELRRS